MPMPTSPVLKRTNAEIANAIRNQATPDYQRRVPVATDANLTETFAAIQSQRTLLNEFETALTNKIAMQIVRDMEAWVNPLAKFKLPKLAYGHTIEEIKVGLLNAYAHDDGADYGDQAIWSRETPRVEAAYHSVNRKDKYKVTIPRESLRSAFITEGGLGQFAAQLLNAATTSDAWDEFLLMSSLFGRYEDADGFFKVNVADLGSVDSDGQQSRAALRRFREMAGNLGFISERYNASKMPSAVKPGDLELFITPEANAAIDVEALAGAFNIDRAEIGYRTTLIPKEHFNIPGAQAILTSRDFFVVADQVYETANIFNPANLTEQHFLHHWQAISASLFVPAILFGTDAGTVIELQPLVPASVSEPVVTDIDAVAVSEVERGASYKVASTGLTGEDVETATILTVEGAEHVGTFITQTGTLHVSRAETSDEIVIVSTSTTLELEARTTLTVTGDIVFSWPNPQVVSDGDADGLAEVESVAPSIHDGTVTIPTVRGVQYQVDAANVSNGSTHEAPVTVSAVARAGYELAGDELGPWEYTA